ncbi:MAG: hypothetical protein C4321_02765 [Chloroflexota bacterium]
MERAEALSLLPAAYATALRLEQGGFGRDVIAQAVGVEVEAVDNLLRVARSKLDALLEETP